MWNEKKEGPPDHLWNNFLWQFVNNFSALLLCKIYVFDIFDMVDVLQIFFISRSNESLISSEFQYFFLQWKFKKINHIKNVNNIHIA